MGAVQRSGTGRLMLVVLALVSAFLLLQAFGALPFGVTDVQTRWAAMVGFGLGALGFGVGGSVLWCALFAIAAVVLNPLYPLPLGDALTAVKIAGGVLAAAAVVRNW